jgi:hypothetical protein
MDIMQKLMNDANYPLLRKFALEFDTDLDKFPCPDIVYKDMNGTASAQYSHLRDTIYLSPDATEFDFVHELFHAINWNSGWLKFLWSKLFYTRRRWRFAIHSKIYESLDEVCKRDVNGEGYIAELLLNASDKYMEVMK